MRYLEEMLILNSFSFEDKDLKTSKTGFALRLLGKGLFYIRAMIKIFTNTV